MKINRLICAALFVTALTACGARETSVSATSDASTLEPEAPASPARIALGPVRALETPAGERSAEPFVTIDSKGAVLLTWLQRAESGTTLWFARRAGEGWSAPAAIVESDDLFVNWADFPSITSDNSGRLLAHWLQKRGSGSYAYDVRLASSRDGGATWSPSIVAHDDGTETEHGFVSMLPHPDGARFAVVWLDGRNMKESNGGHGEGSMTLRYAALDPATMKLSDEAQLDERTCECCQTSMAMTPRGPVVAYRDRSEAELRDIAVVRWMGERWSAPSIVHPDGWEINGCPVNGPQIAAAGDRVAVAWFSAAGKEPRVQVAFSDDGGASFAAPVRVDDGKAIGRVDVLLDGSGAAVVTWLEEAGKTAIVRARTVGRDGWRSDTIEIARTESSRSSGVPRIASDGRTVYFTWTEPGADSRVRIASSDIREVSE